MGWAFTSRKAGLLALQAQNLERGLNIGDPQNHLINEQMPDVVTFARRLENIRFQEEIRGKYIDPVTRKIMNFPYFIGCHNIDHPTYMGIKEKDEANRLCPYPQCKKPILFSVVKRNFILASKIEAYVVLQEAKARSRLFSPLVELKRELRRREEQVVLQRDLSQEDRKSSKDSKGAALNSAAGALTITDPTSMVDPAASFAAASGLNISSSDVTINIKVDPKIKASMS